MIRILSSVLLICTANLPVSYASHISVEDDLPIRRCQSMPNLRNYTFLVDDSSEEESSPILFRERLQPSLDGFSLEYLLGSDAFIYAEMTSASLGSTSEEDSSIKE